MVEISDEEYEAVTERGREVFATEPHAKSARYDPHSGLVTLELYNGCIFSVPARQLQGLERATDAELSEIEVLGLGYGVHWETLDADFTVRGLMAGRFGNAAFMVRHHTRMRALLSELEGVPRNAAA
jgi:hypothetical protein